PRTPHREFALAVAPLLPVRIDAAELARRPRPQAAGARRIGLGRPPPGSVAEMAEPLLRQHAENLLNDRVPDSAERFIRRKRQLERRALEVIDEDVQVVRVDERVLRGPTEEVGRIADDELIERRA